VLEFEQINYITNEELLVLYYGKCYM